MPQLDGLDAERTEGREGAKESDREQQAGSVLHAMVQEQQTQREGAEQVHGEGRPRESHARHPGGDRKSGDGPEGASEGDQQQIPEHTRRCLG